MVTSKRLIKVAFLFRTCLDRRSVTTSNVTNSWPTVSKMNNVLSKTIGFGPRSGYIVLSSLATCAVCESPWKTG